MTHRQPAELRAMAIERVRRQLLQHGLPRLQMALIVALIMALTGGFGLPNFAGAVLTPVAPGAQSTGQVLAHPGGGSTGR